MLLLHDDVGIDEIGVCDGAIVLSCFFARCAPGGFRDFPCLELRKSSLIKVISQFINSNFF